MPEDRVRLYGLKTCDTCRAAMRALAGAGLSVDFVDVRDTPLDGAMLVRLVDEHGDASVNRRSKTWAALGAEERALAPAELLARHPVAMKRPVIVAEDRIYLGWTDGVRAALIS